MTSALTRSRAYQANPRALAADRAARPAITPETVIAELTAMVKSPATAQPGSIIHRAEVEARVGWAKELQILRGHAAPDVLMRAAELARAADRLATLHEEDADTFGFDVSIAGYWLWHADLARLRAQLLGAAADAWNQAQNAEYAHA